MLGFAQGYVLEHVQVGNLFVAALFHPPPGADWVICITRSTAADSWEGCAAFPFEMGLEAYNRLSMLHVDQDVEALLREFGSEEDYEDFQLLESWESWVAGGGA